MIQSKSNWKFASIEENQIDWNDGSSQLSPVIKELLQQRGLKTAKEVEDFLVPSINNLLDPNQLSSMDIAKERVLEAIERNEKILVFGDYDADGVSSTTILIKTLQELGAKCDFYIPNRFTEGYGPNEQAFRQAHQNGFQLIITVDCGIASIHEADVAKELGIDLIITDHHEPQEELPDALAILHPKCSPDYSFKELAGAGVAFKFAECLLGYFPEHLLDLVAIGTVADLVPLVEENRILVYYGLQKLSSTAREGLIALKNQCKIEGKVNEEDIGFLIGPRLNAVGRLQDADLAVELLLCDDKEIAEELAEIVNQLNTERQQIVASIVKEVEETVEIDAKKGVIVVAKQGWNEGVLGIVASRLVRKYDRPAIVLAINEEKGLAKGSARSIPAFDLFQSCMKIKDVFTHFGGHSQAAGMTLPIDNVQHLEQKLDEIIKNELTSEDFKQEVLISRKLKLSEISENLVTEISQLAPFGMANPKPKFLVESRPVDIRQLGNMKKHLKLLFKEDTASLDGIAFGMGNLHPLISPQATVSVVGELGINEWNGIRKVQMMIEDVKINHWQLFDHRGKRKIDFNYDQSHFSHQFVIYNTLEIHQDIPNHIKHLTYKEALEFNGKVEVLYLLELPQHLHDLHEIITKFKPVNIHACFYVENSVYMAPFPKREDFKWLYSLIWKNQELSLDSELNKIMKAKGWTEELIQFMLDVFSELEFVNINNGLITLNKQPQKKDLQEARAYQNRIKQGKIEKTLYYATYNELLTWFEECRGETVQPKEEITHGL
ncbi:single-stranded-DNA-specific exonuclease RecJ [Ornithinibacillus halotolerans]|uniref:Single-stranded-DNA-specific exonuclease RecJ n=1 Tax=Ornithinibacillus halotolerans TaxID=1274357 RepID=A0A916RVL9_9BACI|nr:single-stranded-DNA-specific exonuclease RecJ [Ornithinibacillus halotolerans]GGA69208.1 single-stranded-DNA-specific exonuclease RecJ [Ornithinibacillus halotolerans]